MDLNKFAVDVHANAVAHGWWDEEYTDAAVIALIHAEISEAFEEWRAGHPMLWHECGGSFNGRKIICEARRCPQDYDGKPKEDCVLRQDKPEGIAVELIDVVLRILDTAAAWELPFELCRPEYIVLDNNTCRVIKDVTVPELTTYLHRLVTNIDIARAKGEQNLVIDSLGYPLSLVFVWLRAHDIDPEALMMEKHRYNQQRSYKHGGKRC